MKEIVTTSPAETERLGFDMAMQAGPGTVFALDGDLGAGKTVFAKGFAKGLGITDSVNSPTFTILQVYGEGRLPFYHFDVYRIEDPLEMEEIGYEEYFDGDGVCLIEWASLIEEILPPETIHIMIKRQGETDDSRLIRIDRP